MLNNLIFLSFYYRKYLNYSSQMDLSQYQKHLNETFNKIVQACVQDEALQTLKMLENKEYLLQRINQLFAQIYIEERQNKIIELIKANSLLSKQYNANSTIVDSENCESCQVLHQKMLTLEKQKALLAKKMTETTQFQSNESRKIDKFLLEKNHGLEKQLKQFKNQMSDLNKQFSEEKKQLIRLNQNLRQQLKNQMEENQSSKDELNKIIKATLEKNNKLQKQLLYYMQHKQKQEQQLREANIKATNLVILKQKHNTEILMLKQQNCLLEQTKKKIEEEIIYLKQSLTSIEKQYKQVKKKNIQLTKQINLNITQNGIKLERHNCESSTQLLYKCNRLQKLNIQFEKQNNDLKREFICQINELNDRLLEKDKQNLKLTEYLKKNQASYNKQIRIIKQQHKTILCQRQQKLKEQKEQNIQLLVKSYENRLHEKIKQLEKITENNQQFKKNIQNHQQIFSQKCLEWKKEKTSISKQLEKQKQKNRQMKKYYNQNMTSLQIYEEECSQKLKFINSEKDDLKRKLDEKEKQIKHKNNQIYSLEDKISNKDQIIFSLRFKNQQYLKQLNQTLSTLKQYKEISKQKQRLLVQLKQSYENLSEQKESYQNKVQKQLKNKKKVEEKNRIYQKQLREKAQQIRKLHQQSKTQIINIYNNNKQMTNQSKKQLQSYYLSLLQMQEQKRSQKEHLNIANMKSESINLLETIVKISQQKTKSNHEKYLEEIKQREFLESKIRCLYQEQQCIRSQNKKLNDQLKIQRQKNLQLLRTHQQRISLYSNKYSQFKKQLFINLKCELDNIKKQVEAISSIVQNQFLKMRNINEAYSTKIYQQIQKIEINNQLNINKIHHQYEYGIVYKLKEQKRQAQISYQLKNKEQSMQFYTILSQKDNIIAGLQLKVDKNIIKLNNIESTNQQLQKIASQTQKKLEEYKKTANQMNQKVIQIQKDKQILKNELNIKKKQNTQLHMELRNLENKFKDKIQKCRQNYVLQNQRIFNKYERQITKFIVPERKCINSYLLNNSKSSSNILIPTKGCNDDKIQLIKIQIQQQKKKLTNLEDGSNHKIKIDKTRKNGAQLKLDRVKKF